MKALILFLFCSTALAAGNAPDVHGRFVLVASATVSQPMPATYFNKNFPTALMQQPLTVIQGFDSFYRCRGAGLELQARMRSNGYVIDFSCLLQGK